LHQTNAELALKNEVLSSTLEKLKVTQDQLIQSEKMASLGVLASGIAHEINNPLNYIASGIFSLKKYLEKKYGGKEEELERILQVLNSGLHRSSTIITNLNRYSRKDDTAWSKCNIHEIVESCLLMLQNQTKYRIEIKQETEGHAYELICNEGKIHQAILNILSNAVQSIEGKGIITIKTELERSMLCVSITDNGCGIKEEHLSKIFDPFFTTKEPGKGTGLGLSITYNIMKEHDGSIEYHSEHGKGTTVILKLPVAVTGNSI
jgi:signal transduction histidine kinase